VKLGLRLKDRLQVFGQEVPSTRKRVFPGLGREGPGKIELQKLGCIVKILGFRSNNCKENTKTREPTLRRCELSDLLGKIGIPAGL